MWARAEQGHDIPSRMVLSGHCFGDSVWDGGTANLGELEFSSIRALAAAMPCARARRGPHDLRLLLRIRRHSPSGAQAIGHIAAWANATRGRVQSLDGKRAVDSYFAAVNRAAREPSKIQAPQLAGNVSVWTASQGYVPGKACAPPPAKAAAPVDAEPALQCKSRPRPVRSAAARTPSSSRCAPSPSRGASCSSKATSTWAFTSSLSRSPPHLTPIGKQYLRKFLFCDELEHSPNPVPWQNRVRAESAYRGPPSLLHPDAP